MSEPTIEPRAVTPVFGWPVPVLGDVPNIPSDLNALALGIEGTLNRSGHGVASIAAAINNAPAGDYLIPLSAGQGLSGGVTFTGSGLKVPIAGRWVIAAEVTRNTADWYYTSNDIYINGAWSGVPGDSLAIAASSGYMNMSVTFPKRLAANDLVTIHANCSKPNIPITTAVLTVSYIGV